MGANIDRPFTSKLCSIDFTELMHVQNELLDELKPSLLSTTSACFFLLVKKDQSLITRYAWGKIVMCS